MFESFSMVLHMDAELARFSVNVLGIREESITIQRGMVGGIDKIIFNSAAQIKSWWSLCSK